MKAAYWLVLSLVVLSNGQAQEQAVAARVNGVPITELRLDRYFADYLQAQGRAVASIRNPSAYKRLRQAALDELIDKQLLLEAARERGLVADEHAVEAQLTTLRGNFGSPQNFDRRLAEAGFDETSFRQYLREEWAAQQVFSELTRTPEPTPAEVEAAWLRANPGALLKLADSPQNQSSSPPVERARELAMVREMIINQRQAQARAQALKQLRSRSRIELARDQ